MPGNAINNATITFNTAPYTNNVYDGVISGTGSVNKMGYGNLWLTNANTFTGSSNNVSSDPSLTWGFIALCSPFGPAVQGDVNMQGGYWLITGGPTNSVPTPR